ncbi:diguanylate cyclase [Oleispirillum naphthae]|uniref:diguanylate cyclase n=1 Tax=Oleispirillum naphthae TaxID=2838853 RepID=UPI003082479B
MRKERVCRVWWLAAALALWPAAARALDLSAEERAFVRAQPPVTVCVDPDWAPFEWIDEKGIHRGIAADLARLAASRVGLSLELAPTKDWDESLAASQAGRCRILSFLNRTEKRETWLLFTAPIFSDPNVFITREEHPFIADPAQLSGERIVFPSGTAMEENIRRDYPNLRVLTVPSEAEAIAMVSDRRAEMTMRSLIVAAYTIKGEGLFNLKIAGKLPDYANRLRIGVRRSEPLLRDVLNKGVASISRADTEEIVNRHVSLTVQADTDYGPILRVVGIFAAIAAFGAFHHLRLRRLNRKLERISQTDALTGLPNRGMIDAHLAREVDRAQRHRRDLALVMLDIDHFKAVNDDLGHLIGDRLLVEVAHRIRDTVRGGDIAGRWGGEEFLVVCPETALHEAMAVAERIRAAVAGGNFAAGRAATVSAGVAAFSPGDSVDALLQRADAALYRAKAEGRNCVRTA